MTGRSGGARTPNPRFWRPVLYQLSYTPAGAQKARAFIAATTPRTQGARRPSDQELPPESTVTARRFCDQQEMSSQTATGRSLP